MENGLKYLRNNHGAYLDKACEYAESDDYIRALEFCYSALKLKPNYRVYATMASIYLDMGLYDASIKSAFKYLDKAPKEEQGEAFITLAIDYFNLGNLAVAGYYLGKKMEVDGVIEQDALDDEMLEYFSKENPEEEKRFRLVYPLEKADYSDRHKKGKRLIANGEFKSAIKVLESVPEGVKDYDLIADDLAIAHFLAGDVTKAIEVNRKRLKDGGRAFSTYCNLVSLYKIEGDDQKAEYYYSLAVKEDYSGTEDEYRLATTALEMKDTARGLTLLNKVLQDRKYDDNALYLRVLACINAGQIDGAIESLSILKKIEPDEYLYDYYLSFTKRLLAGDESAKQMLPLSYELDIPEKARAEFVDKMRKLTPANCQKAFSNQIFEVARWGVNNYGGNDVFAKACILTLGSNLHKRESELLKEKLLDNDISEELKIVMIYVLIMNGETGKLALSTGGVFRKIKINKPNFGKDLYSARMNSVYALCFAKSVVIGVSDLNKIAWSAQNLCEKMRSANEQDGLFFGENELCAVIIKGCEFPYFKSFNEICKIYGADPKIASEIIKKMENKND